MKEILKNYIKKLFSDSHAAIVGIVAGSLLLGTGTIYIYFQALWLSLTETIQSPTPLWASIALALLLTAYIYLKSQSSQSTSTTPPTKTKPKYIIKFFTIGQCKWETKIYDGNYFEINEYPFCIAHDLRFIFGYNGKYCPHVENFIKCGNRLSEYDEFAVYETAKSSIEKKIRNKEY